MSPVSINGKSKLLPFGTSMGYVIDTSSRGGNGHTLETASLTRSLVGGGYAEVRLPKLWIQCNNWCFCLEIGWPGNSYPRPFGKTTYRRGYLRPTNSAGAYSSFGYQSTPRPPGVKSRMAQSGSRSGAPRGSSPGSAISGLISPAQK